MQKQKILDAIDDNADTTTREIVQSLTEEEASKLAGSINRQIEGIDGVTPIVSILELRRADQSLSYKLKLETQIWSGTNLSS